MNKKLEAIEGEGNVNTIDGHALRARTAITMGVNSRNKIKENLIMHHLIRTEKSFMLGRILVEETTVDLNQNLGKRGTRKVENSSGRNKT